MNKNWMLGTLAGLLLASGGVNAWLLPVSGDLQKMAAQRDQALSETAAALERADRARQEVLAAALREAEAKAATTRALLVVKAVRDCAAKAGQLAQLNSAWRRALLREGLAPRISAAPLRP